MAPLGFTLKARLARRGIAGWIPMGVSCLAFERLLPRYLDAGLPFWRCLVFEVHLKFCPTCRDILLYAGSGVKNGSATTSWLRRIEAREAATRRRGGRLDAPIDEMLPVFDGPLRRTGPAEDIPLPATTGGLVGSLCNFIAQIIDHLPESYRNILQFHGIEEMSIRQVAEVLDLTQESTRKRLHKARSALTGLCEPLSEEQA